MEQAKQDIKRITSDLTGFAVPITFTDPLGYSVIVNGIHTKIRLVITTEGDSVNSKRPYVSVSEDNLLAAGYNVRNLNREVALVNHMVQVADSSGNVCSYIIREVWPDERVGLLVCFLSDFE